MKVEVEEGNRWKKGSERVGYRLKGKGKIWKMRASGEMLRKGNINGLGKSRES